MYFIIDDHLHGPHHRLDLYLYSKKGVFIDGCGVFLCFYSVFQTK